MKKIKTNKHVEKPVFALWTGDTAEVVSACIAQDKNNWSLLPKIAENVKEQLKID